MKRFCNRVFALSSRPILATKDCLSPTVRTLGTTLRTLGTTTFFEPFYALIAAATWNTRSKERLCRLARTGCVHFPQLPFFSLYHDA